MINTFECLSDHLLSEIFSYLSPHELYQGFYFLNSRFSTILRSLTSLELVLRENDEKNVPFVEFSRLYSLILIGQIDIRLSTFPHLHRLVLRSPRKEFFSQFDDQIEFSSLEFLSISNIFFELSSIYEKIFSNRFPRLRICHIDGFETIETIRPWTKTSSLERLRLGSIDFHVYKSLLSACPFLQTLQFEIFQSYLKLSSLPIHRNLTKLILKSEITDWNYNDQWLDRCLQGVPCLKMLILQRFLPLTLVFDLIPDYHWWTSILDQRLSYLESFIFHFHIEIDHFESISNEMRRRLRNDFLHAHENRFYLKKIRFFV